MPSLGVCVRQPLHEFLHLVIGLRPEDEMPVIGHQAIRQNADWHALVCLCHDLFKCSVVFVLAHLGFVLFRV